MNFKKFLSLVWLTLLLSFFAYNRLFGEDLTPEQENKLISHYSVLDTNSDNSISDEELKSGLYLLPTRTKRSIINYLSHGDASTWFGETATYKVTEQGDLKLDIFYPTAKVYHKDPIVIYIHGGAYQGGTRRKIYNYPSLVNRLLYNGFAVATIDYRLAKPGANVMMNLINEDCKDALRYLAKNSDYYGLDRNKFITWGTSAGGSLAYITALTEPNHLPGSVVGDVEHTVIGCIIYFGLSTFDNTEITPIKNTDLFKINNGLIRQDIVKLTSPDFYLSRNSPPVLHLHGNRDANVPAEHGRYIKDYSNQVRAELTYIELDGVGHGFKPYANDAYFMEQIDYLFMKHIYRWMSRYE